MDATARYKPLVGSYAVSRPVWSLEPTIAIVYFSVARIILYHIQCKC